MSDYRIEWKLNLSLLEMIRISEENEKEMKQRLLLEKTVALQQMERQKRIMEIEKGKEIEEMSKECKLAKEKMETETRRADALSLHSLELSFRAAQAETELNELKMKCERELPNSIDYVVCNDCLDEFKRKKMKMCMECAERKTSPPILCGFCVFEKHSNHRVIDYLPHLINHSFSSVVANGNLTSTNSQTESSKKMEKGYECMEKWRKELNKFSNAVDFEEISHRDSLEIDSNYEVIKQPYIHTNCGHTTCYSCSCWPHCLVCHSRRVGYIKSTEPQSSNRKLNSSLLEMIRIAEENEKELKKHSILEKTQAIQEMERQKRVVETENTKKIEELEREKKKVEAEKQKIVEEMSKQCKIAESEKQRAEEASARASSLESELSELKKKCEEGLPNSIDYVVCVDCLEEFKRERMKICIQCSQEKSPLPILCGFCVFENHSNHKIIKYLPHTVNAAFSSAVATSHETVTNSQNECTEKMEIGYECMEKWREEMSKFANKVNFNKVAYRESLEITSSIRYETDFVHSAATEVLPVLEQFAQAVQKSSTRLAELHQTLSVDESEDIEET